MQLKLIIQNNCQNSHFPKDSYERGTITLECEDLPGVQATFSIWSDTAPEDEVLGATNYHVFLNTYPDTKMLQQLDHVAVEECYEESLEVFSLEDLLINYKEIEKEIFYSNYHNMPLIIEVETEPHNIAILLSNLLWEIIIKTSKLTSLYGLIHNHLGLAHKNAMY